MLKRGNVKLLDTFTFVSGQRQTRDLQVPSKFLQRLYCNMNGQLTVSAVAVPGTVHADGASNLLNNVELQLDGKTLKNASGPSYLRVANRYAPTVGQNNGIYSAGAGVYLFNATIPLFFEAIGSVSPQDTLVDGRAIKTMTMNLTWGTTASLIFGNTSTLALANVTCDIYAKYTEPFETAAPFWAFREIDTQCLNPVTTSGQSRMPIPFNPGSVMRSIQLRAIDGNDLSDAMINSVNLRINGGEETPLESLEDDFASSLPLYEEGGDFDPTGYIHLELAENGKVAMTGLGAKLAGKSINSIDIVANTTAPVSGTGNITAHTCEHVPPGGL